MPTYEYACNSCDHTMEAFQSMKDAPLTSCPQCGQEALRRLIGRGAAILFKGTGFYETDYKPKKSTDAAPAAAEKPAASPASGSAPAAS
jgi:putative FmdB family regulatory protein